MEFGVAYNSPEEPKRMNFNVHFPGEEEDYCVVSWLRIRRGRLKVRIDFPETGVRYEGIVRGRRLEEG